MFLEGIRDELLLNYVIAFQVVSMALAFLILTCNILGQAPYGRYIHSKWWTGPQLPSKPMWILQESPAVLVPAFYLFSTGKWRDMLIESPNANTALLLAVCAHYTYRSFIFPFLLRGGKPTTLFTVALAVLFCIASGLIHSLAFCSVLHYPASWIYDVRFLVGMTTFVIGLYFNISSDNTLRNLRKPGETGYKIPRGGLFEYVSCANYTAELLEWSGLALAGWSLPSSVMLITSALNLVPRARKHHEWYLEKFEDYPKSRRAVIPCLL